MAAPPITERHKPHFHRQAPIKESVRAATEVSITIATALNNGDTLDGLTLATGDRVLVKDQTTGADNGIYVVGTSPARDYDVSADDPAFGFLVYVREGTNNGGKVFKNTNTSAPTIGTTALVFSPFTTAVGGVLNVGRWRWTLTTTTPGTSRLGLAVQPPVANTAATLQIHENDSSGIDRSPYLDRMNVGDSVVIDDGDGNVFQHVITGSITDNGTWRSIPVTYDPRATTPLQPAEVICEVLLLRAGSTGSALTIEEVDGSPTGTPTKLVFPNGTLGIAAGVATYTPSSAGSTIITKDEGTTLSSSVTTLDFTGAGVTASGAGATTTVNIPGGGGASFSTVGYNTVGGSQLTWVNKVCYATKITLGATACILSIGAHIQMATSAGTGHGVVIWADSSGSPVGAPMAMNAGSMQFGNGSMIGLVYGATATGSWIDVPIATVLPAGDYWIGFMLQFQETNWKIYYDGSGSDKEITMNDAGYIEGISRTSVASAGRKYSIRASVLG